jgi:Ca2+-binding EF-hand superfamily protein
VISTKEAFDIFDSNKSGLIDPVELKNAFESLGFANSNKFVHRILHDCDASHPQGLDFGAFLRLSTGRL